MDRTVKMISLGLQNSHYYDIRVISDYSELNNLILKPGLTYYLCFDIPVNQKPFIRQLPLKLNSKNDKCLMISSISNEF